ncbi:hypothetical protein ACQBAU_09855 [Propionibacteriaceae bacterium Y2011]|uniref:hypothetical protein n=1 Tax=Microlunatus sp. Y2014 TaxID=3418488 RepID=UPI003B4E2CBA
MPRPQTAQPPPTPVPHPLPATARTPVALGTLAAALMVVLGVTWWLVPEWNYFSDPNDHLITPLITPTGSMLVMLGTALIGLATGVAALFGVLPRTGLMIGAASQVIIFGFVLQGMGTLSTAGYLVAVAMPVAVVVLLVQVVRRYPRARWFIGLPGLALLLVGAFWLREPLATLVPTMAAGLFAASPMIMVTATLITATIAWGLVLVRAWAGAPSYDRAFDAVVRHRRVITVLAACGPLPYALLRLTWLTPFRQFAPGEMGLDTVVWGLTLSSGAWLGFVLTLGLIRPWGEVFPRWMPGLAARPVPIAAAAVPGGTVAVVLTAAALPILVGPGRAGWLDRLELALVFPCWAWGPLLGLAVWGYIGHRQRTGTVVPATPTATVAA